MITEAAPADRTRDGIDSQQLNDLSDMEPITVHRWIATAMRRRKHAVAQQPAPPGPGGVGCAAVRFDVAVMMAGERLHEFGVNQAICSKSYA
jgi:hypothetical protein